MGKIRKTLGQDDENGRGHPTPQDIPRILKCHLLE